MTPWLLSAVEEQEQHLGKRVCLKDVMDGTSFNICMAMNTKPLEGGFGAMSVLGTELGMVFFRSNNWSCE